MAEFVYALLPKEVERGLVAACRNRLPHETCGVLYGHVSGSRVMVDGFSVIRNAASQPAASFSFAPDDWTPAYFEAQRNRRIIVGFFHSHPDSSPVPSVADAQGWLPWGTYWIVGLMKHSSRVAAYVTDTAQGWRELPLLNDEGLEA